MTLVPDEYVFAPATVAETSPVIDRHLPGAEVTSDCFDAFVTVLHGPDDGVPAETAFRIARDLRGGRDVDRERPADWHVRSIEPRLLLTDAGDHPRERERIGTDIWLSRTYSVPEGYAEDATGDLLLSAPGARPSRP